MLILLVWSGLSVASGQAPAKNKTSSERSPIANKSAAPVDQDTELHEVMNIAAAGAPGLALRMMDRVQNALLPQSPRWIKWEQQRLKIHTDNQDWDSIIKRVAKLPVGVNPQFTRQFISLKVQALLQLHRGEEARAQLRSLILSLIGQQDEASLDWLRQWRRMLIQSYIAEGISDDALISILRFQQDYQNDKKDILLLRARVLLMTQSAAEAVELLTEYSKDPEAGMLFLLAQLRSDARKPVKVMQAGLRHLRGKSSDKALRRALWSIVAEAAQRAGDKGAVVNALEHVVAESSQASGDKLFAFGVDSLWDAYIDYAQYAGNRDQLLIGQDEEWLDYANKSGKKYPLRQRAIYALLLLRGGSAELRREAATLFIKSLQTRRNNSQLILQLFSHSQHFATHTEIPEPVRRALVDIALARQNIPLASQLMATLKEPPAGNTSYMWHLRRARILILGGQPRDGAQALVSFTQNYPKANKTQLDRFLQVVFDLQTVGEHDAAYQLFNDVIQTSDDQKLKRELYYWMADSRHAQRRYAEAAELYLKSAMLLDGKGLDPWGQTARYQAAKSLGKAGLYEDAYFLFQHLLRVTKEEERKAVLRYELQKLQLARVGDQELTDIPASDNVAPGK